MEKTATNITDDNIKSKRKRYFAAFLPITTQISKHKYNYFSLKLLNFEQLNITKDYETS